MANTNERFSIEKPLKNGNQRKAQKFLVILAKFLVNIFERQFIYVHSKFQKILLRVGKDFCSALLTCVLQ